MKIAFFVDRGSPRALRAARLWMDDVGARDAAVIALEPSRDRIGGKSIPVAQFFAGDLRTPEGESVGLAAYRLAGAIAFDASDLIVSEEPALAQMNDRLGRNTLRLMLGKRFYPEAREVVVRMLVARALKGESESAFVVLPEPEFVPSAAFDGAVRGVKVRFYRRSSRVTRRARAIARALGSVVIRRIRRSIATTMSTENSLTHGGPALLTTHEDELTLDRRVRSQPHWLDPDGPRPSFRTLVFPTDHRLDSWFENEGLRRMGIVALTDRALGSAWRRRGSGDIQRKLRGEQWRALLLGFTSSLQPAVAAMAVLNVIEQARLMVAVMQTEDVRCLLTGEPYTGYADAMAFAAAGTNVPLVGFQYSNLATVSPPMCLTADHFALFARAFKPLWQVRDISPLAFSECGYPFDGAFARVKDRAWDLRAKLLEKGARIIVCYFDESVQHDRYGVIGPRHHLEEVLAIARRVVDDPGFAVIVKSQFRANSPSNLYPNNVEIAKARETGRYVELLRGKHRNIVFPAEAAMASDIAIGHLVGATAPLEAALAGCRSIMLDTLGQVRHLRELYEKADIIYPTIDEALRAIDAFQLGDPGAVNLGDWTPIIRQLDSFMDGQSGQRLRRIIEDMMRQTEAVA